MTRVVFMGTPEFATPILQSLAESYEVVAVYTRPDKPAGRGQSLVESPVKQLARKLGLAIEQPRTLRHSAEQERLREYRPDLIVVAAYGLILPPPVLSIPPHGCLNIHASLLPRWRGAAPIPYAILAGDTETGVTLMQMDEGLDTGPILAQRAIPLTPDETTGRLTLKLAHLGADLLRDVLPLYLAGKLTATPQDHSKATMTRLVIKEDGRIDWHKRAVEIERMVRAYHPWPSAFTFYAGALLKILGAAVAPTTHPREVGADRQSVSTMDHMRVDASAEAPRAAPISPGTVIPLGKEIGVMTGEGILLLRQVQLAGKRAMSANEFARGQRGFIGAVLGTPRES